MSRNPPPAPPPHGHRQPSTTFAHSSKLPSSGSASTTPVLLFRPNDPLLIIGEPRLVAKPVSSATFVAYQGADAAYLNFDCGGHAGSQVGEGWAEDACDAADDTKHSNGPVTTGDRMRVPANIPVGPLFPIPTPRPVPVPVPVPCRPLPLLQTAILDSASTTPLLLFRPTDPSQIIGESRLGAAPVSTVKPTKLCTAVRMQDRGWERVAPMTLAMVAGCTPLTEQTWKGLDLDNPRRIRFLVSIDRDVWRIPANFPPAYQQLSGQVAVDIKHPNGAVTTGDPMWEPVNMPIGSLFPIPAPRPVLDPAVTPASVVCKAPYPTYFAVPPPPPTASVPPHLSPHASLNSSYPTAQRRRAPSHVNRVVGVAVDPTSVAAVPPGVAALTETAEK
ncbi:hypothetical protein HDU96_007294 [Phlyctochytrium bullatum]|nr:hypothetical protein HDU96_007294 [Phlyctochytrium bullatum]